MKTICYLLLFLLMPMTQVLAQTGRVVITGQVVNRKADAPKTVNINLCDWINHTTRINAPLNADGYFHAQMDFSVGHTFTLHYRDTHLLYAAPGDSIHITLNDSLPVKMPAYLTINGRHNGLAQLYNRYNLDMGSFLEEQIMKIRQMPDLSFPEYMKAFSQTYRTLSDSIHSYCHHRHIGTADRKLLCIEALYTLANSYLIYKAHTPKEQLAFYRHPLFRLNDAANLNSMMWYGIHLQALSNCLFEQDSVLRSLPRESDPTAVAQRKLDILLKQPRSISRDIMLSLYFRQPRPVAVPDCSAFVLPAIWRQVYEQAPSVAMQDTAYVRFDCQGDSLTYYNKPGGQAQQISTNDLFRYLHERHPRKVIYIDIYEVGCPGCRSDMKEVPALHTRYAGQDIVFVNLCLNSTPEAWRKLIADSNVRGEHYWLPEGLGNRFIGLINLPYFPTYMLLDRNGRFLTRRAPRPSEQDKLFPLLDSILQPNH